MQISVPVHRTSLTLSIVIDKIFLYKYETPYRSSSYRVDIEVG